MSTQGEPAKEPDLKGSTDMPVTSWIDRLPAPIRPYLILMRADRPIGTWLLLLPCWWSIAIPGPSFPDPLLLLLFAIGAFVMRGAGCTVNDLADRDFDAKVARTAMRPIPSGAVSPKQALAFLCLLLLIGLIVLLQLNGFAILLGAASLILVAVYPFCKRFTYWPQFVLGLTFNWGALLGYAAVAGTLGAPAYLLYAAGLCWTLGYDTIYAHQDKEDDVMVGVKSSALRLGDRTRPFLFVIYALTLALLGGAGIAAELGPLFWPGLVLGALHLFRQAATVKTDDPMDCLRHFKSNREVGLILFVAIMGGHLWP
ncbi:MAG: 4-hydroxybenzoate octaprenyltransferase [Magnetovibrionaceae bacterium]